jgi:hypothetical protein
VYVSLIKSRVLTEEESESTNRLINTSHLIELLRLRVRLSPLAA